MPELRDLPVDRCPPELARGDEWLQQRLEDAEISYNSDDGAGYVLTEAGARVWVTGILEQEPVLESAFRDSTILWSAEQTRVFARPTLDGISYLYWRAGGVDHSVECDVAVSDIPDSLRNSIEALIKAANNHPYNQG